MGRDDGDRTAIDAIVAVGRRTRRPTPRWLWIAAAIAGGVGAIGFAIAVLVPAPSAGHSGLAIAERLGGSAAGATANPGSGFGGGLAIGAALGIAIGIWIGRQRLSHSSRNSP